MAGFKSHDLDDVVKDKDEHETDSEDEFDEIEQEIDEMAQQEHTGNQWHLPLPECANPQYFKKYFHVMKYKTDPEKPDQAFTWVVDHFASMFYCVDKKGKLLHEHAAKNLLQLERHVYDMKRMRMMFYDTREGYEIVFASAADRERFYETAQAIRPAIRVYAPDWTHPDGMIEATTTTIDGIGQLAVTVSDTNQDGALVEKELTGECKVKASKLLTEPVKIWIGTQNLSGRRPPTVENMLKWIPIGKFDLYAIGGQEVSYGKDDEWTTHLKEVMGSEYVLVASMIIKEIALAIFARKVCVLKISNPEGATQVTKLRKTVGAKGAVAISLKYLETSICFINVHLPSRIEMAEVRNQLLEETLHNLRLAELQSDCTNQFNHLFVFGDFNYRVEADYEMALEMIKTGNSNGLLTQDQLNQYKEDGTIFGFQEPPIRFPPTYRMKPDSDGEYNVSTHQAPSYCSRVLTRSMSNTWVKCSGYSSAREVKHESEHTPLSCSFVLRCVRPAISWSIRHMLPPMKFIFTDIHLERAAVCDNEIKIPKLFISSQFSTPVDAISAEADGVMDPAFLTGQGGSKNDTVSLLCFTDCQELLETSQFLLIVIDDAEKKKNRHVGTAYLPLFGRVIGQTKEPQPFELDLLAGGKYRGKITGVASFEPSNK